MQVRPSPLRQPFPSRQLSRFSHQEDAHGSRGRENGRLAGLVLLSLCSQGAAKKGTRKLSCTNHIYWCCSNGLLSIKSSPEIGTLLRKGRDPPQNTKCQETFTGWRNTHCQCSSKCSCSEDNQEAAWLVHTFHQSQDHTKPPETLLWALTEWPEAKWLTTQSEPPFPESLTSWRAFPLTRRFQEIPQLCRKGTEISHPTSQVNFNMVRQRGLDKEPQ